MGVPNRAVEHSDPPASVVYANAVLAVLEQVA